MSDEPTPEVRALAAKLFSAGRAERPGPALGRRLLLIEPPTAAAGSPSPPAGEASGRVPSVLRSPFDLPTRMRVPRARWLAAAALIAGGFGLSFVLEHGRDTVSISAERIRSKPAEFTAPVSAPVAEPAARRKSAADVAPRGDEADLTAHGDAAERSAPRSETAAHPRQRAHRSRVDPAAPQRPAPSASEAAAPPAPLPMTLPMTLLAELELLKRARSALRSGDGAQALELLEQREREHTRNGLDAEA
ncbi:MAG: hypothetical protein RL033_5113, partial [Pseudomonadota bacterium]